MDDLKELLKSVDHDQVVNSTDIISDDALAALLDRSLSSSSAASARINEEATSSGEGAHGNLFVVLEENTGEGNILKSVNANVATTEDNKELPEKHSVQENQKEETTVQFTATAEGNGEAQTGVREDEKETDRAGEKQLVKDETDNQGLALESPPVEKPVGENGFEIQQLTAAED